jgi:hypothetical protein
MRFICLPNSESSGQPPPIKQEMVASWINSSHRKYTAQCSTSSVDSFFFCLPSTYENVSKMLVKLGIWKEVGIEWRLDATFRNNLTGAIFGG